MTRLGIIGTSDIAHVHIIGLITSNQYEIAGCYAPENRQSMTFARKYRLISYSSAEALFKCADAIDITDDLPETMKLAELSLKALKHVFIAQPNRLNIIQMQYLRKLAEESGVILQLGTGNKHCPTYNMLNKTMQKAMVIDIRHQMTLSSNLYTQLKMQLSYDFDFVTSILNANIRKIDVKKWKKTDNIPDVLHCRMECDNESTINLMAYTVVDGEPKTEMIFTSLEDVIRADIFKSIIEKQSRTCNTVIKTILEPYNEKIIHQHYLKNYHLAICNEFDAIRNIDRLFQNIVAADDIIEKIK